MRFRWRLAIGLAFVLGILAAWTVAASGLYCLFTGRMSLFVFPWWQWWQALPWVDYSRETRTFVPLAGAIPSAVVVLIVIGGVRTALRRSKLSRPFSGAPREPERGATDNHGHSQWRSMKDTLDLFPCPHQDHGGIVVGEAYRVDQDTVAKVRFRPGDRRTWGRGGTAPLVIDPCTDGSGHSIVFSGSGGFKTTCAVTTILHWTGGSVILDPSTELGPMLHAAIEDQNKHVAHIGIPTGDENLPPATGFNVLAWIDITHPEAEVHVRTVVSWIYEELKGAGKAEDPFFAPMGRELVTCLLSHLMWSDPQSVDITLATLAAGISLPEDDMLSLLAGIRATSRSQMARRIAGTLMKCKAEETFSGIFMNAVQGVAWLFTSSYADMVSTGDFDPQSLLSGRTTVFLNISLRTLENTPAIARVLVGALLNTVYMANGNSGRRVLFLLDEAGRIGRLRALETARDTGRKYGISLHMLMQSTGQLQEIWGRDNARAWLDSASWVGYAAIRAGGAGKDLSDQIGSYGALAYSEGDNRGSSRQWGMGGGSRSKGSNTNVHEIRRSLMTAAEMQQELREDEIIVVPASGLPIRMGRAIYFRRPELVRLVDENRFAAVAAE